MAKRELDHEQLKGKVVAGRYVLRRRIGRGGFSEVWEADDLITHTRVAVKLLAPGEPARFRREVLLLRNVRVPGVVHILDEGVDEGRPFVVMELVEGTPFPGEGRTGSWTAIADVAVALVETLTRVHAMRVIHRDLKPDNVLVTRDGRPTILDFGIAIDERRNDALTQRGVALGAPMYMAPEQLLCEPVTARTDLYALGLLLYGALTGQLPHAQTSRIGMMRERLTRSAPPLRERAPHAPPEIASLVDALLSREPRDRPASAIEVLHHLRGRPVLRAAEHALPRLGGDAPVRAVVEAAQGGRSVDVVGPRGSGRSRCLHEAAAGLEAAGREVVWARPGHRVFESLTPLLGAPRVSRRQGLADATAALERALRRRLARGAVLIADGLERLDPWSRALIERARADGAIVCARSSAPDAGAPAAIAKVELGPHDEAELRRLFLGPERIFHLPSDAARLLWARTGGLPAQIDEELGGWVRAGIARHGEGGFSVDRAALDQLESGARMSPRSSIGGADPGDASVSDELLEIAAWVSLAFPYGDIGRLAAAMDRPLWELEAGLEALASAGLVRFVAADRIEPTGVSSAEQLWSDAERRSAHRRLAASFAPGEPGRLGHLLAGATEEHDDLAAIAEEALHVADHRARFGHLGHAIAALLDGIVAARALAAEGGSGGLALEERILAAWVEVALAEGTPSAYDRAHYELSRTSRRSPVIDGLERMMKAASAHGTGGDRALGLLESSEPFADPSHERLRQSLRALAAGRCSVETEVAVLDEMRRWAASTGDPLDQAKLAGALGRLRYRQGRFVESARLHAEAASAEPWAAARVAARINAASALLEAFDHEQAAAWGREALAEARRIRHPLFEARAEWILRATAFRLGLTAAPDEDLVEAVTRLGVRGFEATVLINEAAVAYRNALFPRAISLAEAAFDRWAFLQTPEASGVAKSLICAARKAPPSASVTRDLAAVAMRCPIPGLGLQTLALLVRSGVPSKRAWKAAAPALARLSPREHWGRRMDVLSVDECLSDLSVTMDDEGASR